MTVIEQFTKKNFSWKNNSFPASLFRFMLFTHCEMYSAIASLQCGSICEVIDSICDVFKIRVKTLSKAIILFCFELFID